MAIDHSQHGEDFDPLCPQCCQEAATAGFRGAAGTGSVTCPNCGHAFEPGNAVRVTEAASVTAASRVGDPISFELRERSPEDRAAYLQDRLVESLAKIAELERRIARLEGQLRTADMRRPIMRVTESVDSIAATRADLDRLSRDQLPEPERAVANVLDDWNRREHGVISSSHGAGLFLDLLAEEGYQVLPVEALRVN